MTRRVTVWPLFIKNRQSFFVCTHSAHESTLYGVRFEAHSGVLEFLGPGGRTKAIHKTKYFLVSVFVMIGGSTPQRKFFGESDKPNCDTNSLRNSLNKITKTYVSKYTQSESTYNGLVASTVTSSFYKKNNEHSLITVKTELAAS